MITLHKMPDFQTLSHLKASYLETLSAPLDGMWEQGYINPLPHWEIRIDKVLTGYFVGNDERALLQFYLQPEYESQSSRIFQQVVVQNNLTHALAGTMDPLFLRHCLDVQRSVKVHTYLYETSSSRPGGANETPSMRAVCMDELDRTIQFQIECLGIDANVGDWLRQYSANLIQRSELHVLCEDDRWLGLGELRRSETQLGVADVGMMVAPAHRRRGLASSILSRLRAKCDAEGLRAICSTTAQNIAAQKAIVRAGFRSRHRIIRVEL